MDNPVLESYYIWWRTDITRIQTVQDLHQGKISYSIEFSYFDFKDVILKWVRFRKMKLHLKESDTSFAINVKQQHEDYRNIRNMSLFIQSFLRSVLLTCWREIKHYVMWLLSYSTTIYRLQKFTRSHFVMIYRTHKERWQKSQHKT